MYTGEVSIEWAAGGPAAAWGSIRAGATLNRCGPDAPCGGEQRRTPVLPPGRLTQCCHQDNDLLWQRLNIATLDRNHTKQYQKGGNSCALSQCNLIFIHYCT